MADHMPPQVLEVYSLDDWIQDNLDTGDTVPDCARCGECLADLDMPFTQDTSEYVWRPIAWPTPNSLDMVHTWCAVQDGFRLKWDHSRRPVE